MFKTCALLSLCACVGLAANFVTGQGARLVIGQSTFTQQQPGASDTLLGALGGIAYANGILFVADANRTGLIPVNNRVLEFPTQNFPGPVDTIRPFIARCAVCLGQANVVLGQPDFTSTAFQITQTGMRLPTAVATDGTILAVADTGNNRILIWKSIPNTVDQPADIELGQPDFKTVLQGSQQVVDNKSLRSPQGVWIQNGKLFVADTQNHRVLIWNSIPTQNRQPADVVLGQANFNVAVQPDLTKANTDAHANTLLNPVSVSSDGVRLYVADLGNNRVLIWNSIPTTNQQPADVVVGQKDLDTGISNDAPDLCPSNGTDATTGAATFPARCGKTMDFPRFALSDGTRLFIADGGNDRVLIYNTIPTQNGAAADVILGQPDENASVVSSFTDLFHPLLRQSAADITPTPTGLAWDGTNLYVTDGSNRRVLVFTPAEPLVPINGVRNAASLQIFALGSITLSGTITVGDIVKVTITDTAGTAREYDYTMVKDDTLATAMTGLAAVINAGNGDPAVFAEFEPRLQTVKLVARQPGTDGNNIALAVSGSTNATFTITASGSTLQGGQNATILAPGTLVTFLGQNIADAVASADLSQDNLPLSLGGVQLYCDGNPSPLLYVSPTQVNGQIPFEFLDANSISCYLRIQHSDGSVVASTAIAVPLDQQNPGIFANDGEEPRAAIAFHNSSFATGTITVDGSIEAGDTGTITIGDRSYTYTVQAGDTLASVRDAFVALINANTEEEVVAIPEPAFHRIQLRAKVPGPEGNGITFAATTDMGDNANLFLILTNLSNTLCCANRAGAPVTQANPAVPGETILVYATGLGTIEPAEATQAESTGRKYTGPALNDPRAFVSSLAGGSTANVISANLAPGMVGVYEVRLELGLGTPPSPLAQLTISQDIYTSNIVTIPVVDPNVQTPVVPSP